MRTAVLLLTLTSTLAGRASADISYITDARSLSATATTPAGGSGGTGPASSTPSGPVFNDNVSSSSNGPSGGFTSASASQNSQLLADRILGTGHGAATLILGGGSAGSYSAIGRSIVDVTFHISDPAAYTLIALATSSGGGAGVDPNRLLFSLAGPSFESPLELRGTGGSLNQSGLLTPGDYRLQAYAVNSQGFSSSQAGSFDFTLTVPAPTSAAIAALGLVTMSRRRRSATLPTYPGL